MIKFIKYILFIAVSILIIFSTTDIENINTTSIAKSVPVKMQEKDYVNQYCEGIKEYMLPDRTRVDCLTDEYAIEFDYAKKWAESIGQSLYYAKKTGKKPAVAIITSKPEDIKYIQRIKEVDKDITVFEIPAINYNKENI